MVAEDAARLAHVASARTRARTDIRRTSVLALTIGALVAGYLTGQASAAPGLPSCQSEDAPGPCYWDATRDGNGTGRSFVVVDGQVTYLP